VGELSSDPRINQAFEDIKGRIGGRPVPCPICGNDTWYSASRFARVLMVMEEDPAASGEEGEARIAGFRTLALVCTKCSFIRSHLIEDIPEPPPEPPQHADSVS
jgi:hypothetical protein